jgi:acyl carrier protein
MPRLKEVPVDTLGDKIRDIIAVELQIDPQRVLRNANLRQDLGMDSVAALNILFAAEEVFGIGGIDVRELATVMTVADVEVLLRQHLELLRAS